MGDVVGTMGGNRRELLALPLLLSGSFSWSGSCLRVPVAIVVAVVVSRHAKMFFGNPECLWQR